MKLIALACTCMLHHDGNIVTHYQYISYPDGAVLAGLLTWARNTVVSRTSVQFTLKLSLDYSYYNNVSVGDTIPLPGLLLYGDNSQLDEDTMMEVVLLLNVSWVHI